MSENAMKFLNFWEELANSSSKQTKIDLPVRTMDYKKKVSEA